MRNPWCPVFQFLARMRRIDWRGFARGIVTRGYAAALMLIICYAGFLSFRYLYRFVASPVRTPPHLIRAGQSPSEPANLPPLAGLEDNATPAFHWAGRRPFSDPLNGCTLADCHDALPHRGKMKVPAFANMHVAFLDCLTCHTDPTQKPMKSVWISRQTGQPVDLPAVIKLDRLFHDHKSEIQRNPKTAHREIIGLGQQILQNRGDDQTLADILFQIDTAQPGSPTWREGIDRLTGEFARHAVVDYAAKLIPESLAAGYPRRLATMKKLSPSLVASAAGGAERKFAGDSLHEGVLAHPPGCIACHAGSPGQIDFGAAGYLPGRAAALADMRLARVLEQIRLGGQFRLPELTEDRHEDKK